MPILDDLADDGYDIYKIYLEAGGMQTAADKIGVARNTLLVWLKFNNLDLVYAKGRRKMPSSIREKIRQLRLQSLKVITICKRLGISHTTVQRYQDKSTKGKYGSI